MFVLLFTGSLSSVERGSVTGGFLIHRYCILFISIILNFRFRSVDQLAGHSSAERSICFCGLSSLACFCAPTLSALPENHSLL